MPRYLVVLDTPGIKQFVFGTDALAEVRGASALLVRLNRDESNEILCQWLGAGSVQKIFANGGSGQFIVTASDRAAVEAALDALAAWYREQTGGEMDVVAGVAEWPEAGNYQEAVAEAFEQLQLRRRLASGRPTVPTFPLMLECQSTSYLPAQPGVFVWGNERLILSQSSRLKRQESREARRGILWTEWMEFLDENDANHLAEHAEQLRYPDAEGIAECSAGRRKGYIGLVYADGNAMGRLVQELDSPEVYQAFSELVDESIRQACYQALAEVCEGEIAAARQALSVGDRPCRLPADILLLGGDDLLVVLPADRALRFALQVTTTFEQRTKKRLEEPSSDSVRQFFAKRGLVGRGLTISCGVALGPARYPFYMLLELAEELLRSAKRGGSRDAQCSDYWAPAYVDFHLLAGSASHELDVIRAEDYLVHSSHPRTLRPYRRDRLEQLQMAVRCLQQARLPRSKLQDLLDAALDPRPRRAELRARELFGRLREDRVRRERSALWRALGMLGALSPYPWTHLEVVRPDKATTSRPANRKKETATQTLYATALADLVEAYDLFGEAEEL